LAAGSDGGDRRAEAQVISNRQLHEMSEEFEEIEHQTFGKDGFYDAVERIAKIERALGLADIGQFTASPPPKA
jgi:hypothetical protein